MKYSRFVSLGACALGLCAVLALASRHATAEIVYGNPLGIISAPSSAPLDNIGWNSTVKFEAGSGTVIAPSYFISAVHLGHAPTPGTSDTVTLTFNGVTTNYQTALVNPFVQIGDTDISVWKIQGTFPTGSAVQLYGGSDALLPTQALGSYGFGYDRQVLPPVTTVVAGSTVVNGWEWSDRGNNVSYATNTVSGFAVDTSSNLYLTYQFKSSSSTTEGGLATGDSGGGVFVMNGGVPQLAGVNFGLQQFYTSTNPSSAINASIYDGTGLFTSNAAGTALVPATGQTQTQYASLITPADIALIDQIIGVPEPGSLLLGILGAALLSAAGWLRRQRSLR